MGSTSQAVEEEEEVSGLDSFASFVAQAMMRSQMMWRRHEEEEKIRFVEGTEEERRAEGVRQRRGQMRCQRALKQEKEKVFTPGTKEDQYDLDKVVAFVEETNDKPEERKEKTKQNTSKKE